MVGESQETLVGAGAGTGPGSNKTPTLEEYGTNLTTQANEVGPYAAAAGLVQASLPIRVASRMRPLGPAGWAICGSFRNCVACSAGWAETSHIFANQQPDHSGERGFCATDGFSC